MIPLATGITVVILAGVDVGKPCMHYGLASSPRSASAWPMHTPAQGAYLLPPICLCSWLEMARTIPFIDPLVRILCGIIDIRIRRSGIVGGADGGQHTSCLHGPSLPCSSSCSVRRRALSEASRCMVSSIWRKGKGKQERKHAEMVGGAKKTIIMP